MKHEQKFLLIFFLIISSSILSVHSRIKYSRHLTRLSKSLHKGGEPKTYEVNEHEKSPGMRNDQNLCPDHPNKNESESFKKALNFILGMMQQIPQFTFISLEFQRKIDEPNNPQCSSKQIEEQFYHTKNTEEELIQGTKNLMKDYLTNLGDTENTRKLDWANPKAACNALKELYETKLKEMDKSTKTSISLLEAAKLEYSSVEGFNKFYDKCQQYNPLWLDGRQKLLNFMEQINFNGDSDKMVYAYQNKNKWKGDLASLILILEESKEAAEFMKKEYLKGMKLDCKYLPESDEMKKEYNDFSDKFIGGLFMLKQVTTCVAMDSLLFSYFMTFGIKELFNLLKRIFGGLLLLSLELVLALSIIFYYIIKGYRTSDDKLEEKYRAYGNAAGYLFDFIASYLLLK